MITYSGVFPPPIHHVRGRNCAVITWPDVPWIGLTVASVIVNAIFPIVFYPWSKTLWVAVESSLRAEADRGHTRQARE